MNKLKKTEKGFLISDIKPIIKPNSLAKNYFIYELRQNKSG